MQKNKFHFSLFVVYKEGLKEPDYDRVKKYFEAGKPKSEFQFFFKLEDENN